MRVKPELIEEDPARFNEVVFPTLPKATKVGATFRGGDKGHPGSRSAILLK